MAESLLQIPPEVAARRLRLLTMNLTDRADVGAVNAYANELERTANKAAFSSGNGDRAMDECR